MGRGDCQLTCSKQSGGVTCHSGKLGGQAGKDGGQQPAVGLYFCGRSARRLPPLHFQHEGRSGRQRHRLCGRRCFKSTAAGQGLCAKTEVEVISEPSNASSV